MAAREFVDPGRGNLAHRVRQELSPRWLRNFGGPSANHFCARQPESPAETLLRRPCSLFAPVPMLHRKMPKNQSECYLLHEHPRIGCPWKRPLPSMFSFPRAFANWLPLEKTMKYCNEPSMLSIQRAFLPGKPFLTLRRTPQVSSTGWPLRPLFGQALEPVQYCGALQGPFGVLGAHN